MSRNMKYLIVVVVFLALVLNANEAVKKSKKSDTRLKHKQNQQAHEISMNNQGKFKGTFQEEKKPWTGVGTTEKKHYAEDKHGRVKGKIQRHAAGGKKKQGVSVRLEKEERISTMMTTSEQQKRGTYERLKDKKEMQKAIMELDQEPQTYNHNAVDQTFEIEEIGEEECVDGNVDEYVDDSCDNIQSKQKCDSNITENLLIQEDMNGKCYYGL